MQRTTSPLSHQFLFKEGDYLAEMCLEPESLATAYHLRYQAYLEAKAITANAEEQFTDLYDQQNNARTYLIWHEGRAIASVRSLSFTANYSWESTPSVAYFKADVERELGVQIPLLESNKYVVHPDFQGRQSLVAQMLMFRIQSLGAVVDQCDYVITAVRPRHARFYERLMNFRIISEPLQVPDVTFPIQLLATPVQSQKKLAQSSTVAAYQEADLDRYRNCIAQLQYLPS